MIQVQFYEPLPWDDLYTDAVSRISHLEFALSVAVAYKEVCIGCMVRYVGRAGKTVLQGRGDGEEGAKEAG